MKSAKTVANKVGLSEVYDWFLANNPSAGLPYHNERHTNFMMNKVYEVGWITGCSIKDLKILVLAAMFHDFNHSGGELKDSQNIQRALAGLNDCEKHFNLDRPLVETASRLIQVTEYPYVRTPETALECIIRDCDLLQLLDDEDGAELVFEGLPQEMKIEPAAFRLACTNFYLNAQFHSAWAKSNETQLRGKLKIALS